MVVPGPWFAAGYNGFCSGCGDDIEEGDRIRADGDGGYECEECGDYRDARAAEEAT